MRKIYKQNQPVNEFGIPKVSPSIEDTNGLYPKSKMYRHTSPGSGINIFDNIVTSEQFIVTGEYWISKDTVQNVHKDDWVEFSVVDKLDAMGLFSKYGLVVGEDLNQDGIDDFIQLPKFVINDYVQKGCSESCYYTHPLKEANGMSRVIPNLHLRVIYHQYGDDPVEFMWRLTYYE